MAISPVAAVAPPSAAAADPPLPFSTHVAGRTYQADVVRSGAEFVARDPLLLGAEARGSSAQDAEVALDLRIDCLV